MEFLNVDVDTSTSEVTPHLRWNNGVLQQGWVVTHYRDGAPHKRTTEWRDIPDAADAAF